MQLLWPNHEPKGRIFSASQDNRKNGLMYVTDLHDGLKIEGHSVP